MSNELTRDELHELWTRGNNSDRPQFVREHREAILDATTEAVAEAMPAPDASTFEYRQFLNSHAGVVTRQLTDGDEAEA